MKKSKKVTMADVKRYGEAAKEVGFNWVEISPDGKVLIRQVSTEQEKVDEWESGIGKI